MLIDEGRWGTEFHKRVFIHSIGVSRNRSIDDRRWRERCLEEVGRFCGRFCPVKRRRRRRRKEEKKKKKLNRARFLAARLARQKAFPRIYLRVDLEVTRLSRCCFAPRQGDLYSTRVTYDGRKNTESKMCSRATSCYREWIMNLVRGRLLAVIQISVVAGCRREIWRLTSHRW